MIGLSTEGSSGGGWRWKFCVMKRESDRKSPEVSKSCAWPVVWPLWTSGVHSGQTTWHARDLSTSGPSGHFPVSSHKISTIVAEIVSLLEKIYKRDAPFRAVFKVKTLAVLFPPYPREMKTNTRNLNLPPFCRLFVSMEMVQPIPTRALSCARGLSMRTHLTAVGVWGGPTPEVRDLRTSCHSAHAQNQVWQTDWLRIRNEFSAHAPKTGSSQRSRRFLVFTKKRTTSGGEKESSFSSPSV